MSTAITQDMMDAWDDVYSSGHLPKGYHAEPRVHAGRPKLYGDEEMATMTVRLPAHEKNRLAQEARQRGMSLSGYVREVIESRD